MVEQTTCLLIVSGESPGDVRRAFRHLAWLPTMDAAPNCGFLVEASNPKEQELVLRVCKEFNLSCSELQDTEGCARIREEIQIRPNMVCNPKRLRRARLTLGGLSDWVGHDDWRFALIWP
ncbi:MAG: hypothetical protein Q8O97_01985 [bacterium]|nr:hypothetical protein [Candidatus Wildermuthbacteria bacterium]MDP2664717.1 hypothetical protein [bacterium]